VTLSVEDSILRFKAEIIAQDWRLSPKRANQLEAAFTCLREHFTERKATHAMLVMATNVLSYVKNHGASPPETIDFLKEAMAHIVNLHEDLADDPIRDEEVFQALFARFSALKEKIQHKSTGMPSRTPGRQLAPSPSFPAAALNQADTANLLPELVGLPQLIEEFRGKLVQAGETGTALNQLLDDWLLSPAVTELLQNDSEKAPVPADSPPPPGEEGITSCPPTEVRILSISGLAVAIPSSVIALVRPVTFAKSSSYLQNATVPLKDLSRFLQRLSRQFKGNLSLIKDRTLMGLSLPIMVPQGHEFAEPPPTEFSTLVIISNGNWHGALACDLIQKSDQVMVKFSNQPNGDLVGTAVLEDGARIPLLDPLSMLGREGLLLMR
jgi:hypothetical protein